MAMFYLLTLYGVIRGHCGTKGWYVISAAACALGMATKEVMVTAPVVVLVYDRIFLSNWRFKNVFRQRRLFYAGLFCTWFVALSGISKHS